MPGVFGGGEGEVEGGVVEEVVSIRPRRGVLEGGGMVRRDLVGRETMGLRMGFVGGEGVRVGGILGKVGGEEERSIWARCFDMSEMLVVEEVVPWWLLKMLLEVSMLSFW